MQVLVAMRTSQLITHHLNEESPKKASSIIRLQVSVWQLNARQGITHKKLAQLGLGLARDGGVRRVFAERPNATRIGALLKAGDLEALIQE